MTGSESSLAPSHYKILLSYIMFLHFDALKYKNTKTYHSFTNRSSTGVSTPISSVFFSSLSCSNTTTVFWPLCR